MLQTMGCQESDTTEQTLNCKFRVSVQFSPVTQSCSTLCDPMNHSTPGLPSITNSRSLPKLMPIELVMPSSHLILCHSLLLLPPIPPSIRAFYNQSTLCMRWPKYWSFSFRHLYFWCLSGKESIKTGLGKISWRREWQPTPVFLPGEFHGQRSLAGYSPWGHKESDTTEATEHADILKVGSAY